METKKELLEKEKACELEDNALNDVSGGSLPIFDNKTVSMDVTGGSLPIFDNKTVSVNASAEVPFPQNKEELP